MIPSVMHLPALLAAMMAVYGSLATGAASDAEPRIWDVRASRFVSEPSLAAREDPCANLRMPAK